MNATTAGPRFAPLHPVVTVALLYVLGFAALLARAVSVPLDAGSAVALVAPALLVLLFATTSQADRDQYIARLMVAALMPPILQVMFFADGLPVWAIFGFIVLHVIGFAGAVYWLASATTWIAPPAGTPRLKATALLARLQSLPLVLRREGLAATWVVEHGFENDEARSHRVLLDIDANRGTVYVREQLGAAGAKPRSADEASLRDGVGDEAVDPTRPDAQRVWARCWQTSIIRPAQLAAIPAPARNVDDVVVQLCALVLRSGWVWQPVIRKRG